MLKQWRRPGIVVVCYSNALRSAKVPEVTVHMLVSSGSTKQSHRKDERSKRTHFKLEEFDIGTICKYRVIALKERRNRHTCGHGGHIQNLKQTSASDAQVQDPVFKSIQKPVAQLYQAEVRCNVSMPNLPSPRAHTDTKTAVREWMRRPGSCTVSPMSVQADSGGVGGRNRTSWRLMLGKCYKSEADCRDSSGARLTSKETPQFRSIVSLMPRLDHCRHPRIKHRRTYLLEMGLGLMNCFSITVLSLCPSE